MSKDVTYASTTDSSEYSSIRAYKGVPSTRALSIEADWLRTDSDRISHQVRALHERTRTNDLEARAYEKATRKSVRDLLDELANERGMAWTDIAAATQVSISAIRKWRKGGEATQDKRRSLARIAALLDALQEKAGVPDPAQWMEMDLPLPPGYHVKPLDIYVAGHPEALFDLAELRTPVEHILDDTDPAWRDRRSDFVVVQDNDGQRTIRPRQ